jgi:hypothetical protein
LEAADFVVHDSVLAREKGGQRGAIFLGSAAAPFASDDTVELVVATCTARKGKLPSFDGADQTTDESAELGIGETISQIGVQLETELLELTHPLLLAQSLSHAEQQ